MTSAAAEAMSTDGGNDSYNLIVSDLVALIAHLQASLWLIDAAIAREAVLAEQDAARDLAVLDDVTPHYVAASTALAACDASLSTALNRLIDSGARMPTVN